MQTRLFQVAVGVLLGTLVTLVWFAISKPDSIPAPAGEDRIGGPLPHPFVPDPLRGVSPGGDSLRTSDFTRGHLAVFFGYTSCPDICPLTLSRLARYRAGLPATERERLSLLFVSVDPARDTPERVERYLAAFPGPVGGLISEEIGGQLESWGVHAAPGPEYAEGEYLVEHTARTFLLDSVGAVVATIPPMADEVTISRILDPSLGIRR